MSAKRIWTHSWEHYELLDAGGGKKLERWGDTVTIRPEVQAYFRSEWSFGEWREKAHWEFIEKGAQSGVWKPLKKNASQTWNIRYKGLVFELRLTRFKHLGIFPEQSVNWDLISDNTTSEDRFLNLFAYTGAASLAARKSGADTFHVDSVKQLISWARTNMEHSRLLNVRWVHEDALKFGKREIKRGNQYKGIIMDPPAWGVGANNEKWKLEDQLDELVSTASQLMDPDGFLILNTYSPKVEMDLLHEMSDLYLGSRDCEVSELWAKTQTGKELYFGNVLRAGFDRLATGTIE